MQRNSKRDPDERPGHPPVAFELQIATNTT